MSEEKTLITQAKTKAARFLGYEIQVISENSKRTSTGRRINGTIWLRVPQDVVRNKIQGYMQRDKPIHRPALVTGTAYSIVAQYRQEFVGIVEYYKMASNVSSFHKLQWVMGSSLTKTLAHKLKLSVNQIWHKFGVHSRNEQGKPVAILQIKVERKDKDPLVVNWGDFTLKRERDVKPLNDAPPQVWNRRTELEQRLLANTCEVCKATGDAVKIEVHHIRHLKTLFKPGRKAKPEWVLQMAAMRRKTLVVCRDCHTAIHAGREDRTLESRVQ